MKNFKYVLQAGVFVTLLVSLYCLLPTKPQAVQSKAPCNNINCRDINTKLVGAKWYADDWCGLKFAATIADDRGLDSDLLQVEVGLSEHLSKDWRIGRIEVVSASRPTRLSTHLNCDLQHLITSWPITVNELDPDGKYLVTVFIYPTRSGAASALHWSRHDNSVQLRLSTR